MDANSDKESECCLSARLNAVMRASAIGIWHFEDGLLFWDTRCQAIFGTSPPELQLTAIGWLAAIHEDDRSHVTDAWQALMMSGSELDCQYRIVGPDGTVRHVHSMGSLVCAAPNLEIIGTHEDVSRIADLERERDAERERLRLTLNSIGDAVICTDAEGAVTFLNPTASRLTGWSMDEARGRPFSRVCQFIERETSKLLDDPAQLSRMMTSPLTREMDVALLSRRGEIYDIGFSAAAIRTGDGICTGSIVLVNDVTEVREAEKQIVELARRDSLTGLPNRATFLNKLSDALAEARSGLRVHVLCFIDLDRFKAVNDSGGHAAGDAMLREVAALLVSNFAGDNVAARLGGDEFAVLLRDCTLWEAQTLAERFIVSVSTLSFHWGAQKFMIGASVGAAMLTADSPDLAAVLHQADKACYAAKEAGRNCFRFYDAHGQSAGLLGRAKTVKSRSLPIQ